MGINWTDVESSQIARVGYDPDTLKAYVAFKQKNGSTSTYEYDDVPEEVVTNIINAESAGRQFGATLKFGYSYRRI